MGYMKIAVIIFTLCASAVVCAEYPPDFSEQLCLDGMEHRFDIIVCGAGSAGSVIAGRLTEETSFNVLLLELGYDPPYNSSIPILWANLLKSKWDYQYVSETNGDFFQGLKDKKSSIPRGKMGGGTFGLNVAMYLRPTRRDLGRWADLGNEWSYENIHKFTLKAESFHDNIRYNRSTHNLMGNLHVSRYYSPDPLIPIFQSALNELGLREIDDLNAEDANGYGTADSNTNHGFRCTSMKGYISPASSRSNLKYARGVLVKKVLVDTSVSPFRAVGVQIITGTGTECNVYANHEVILSLGAIATPQTLLLSGIGPKDHLEEHKIPVIANLPVGLGYQDHPCFLMVLSDRNHRSPTDIDNDSRQLIKDTYNLIFQGIPTMGLTQLLTFTNTNKEISDWHDVQIMKMRISKGTMLQTPNGHHKLYNMFGWSDESAALVTELNEKSDTIFLIVILSEVKSTGYVKLRSTNPREAPLIQTNLLSDKGDLDTLLKGVKFARELVNTRVIKDYGLQLEKLNFENCIGIEEDEDYWACAVEQVATGFYHPGCTVRMASENDDDGVLSPDMNVKGFSNLKVADASAMPRVVSRNPNAAVITIAEKLADSIKLSHKKPINYYSNLH